MKTRNKQIDFHKCFKPEFDLSLLRKRKPKPKLSTSEEIYPIDHLVCLKNTKSGTQVLVSWSQMGSYSFEPVENLAHLAEFIDDLKKPKPTLNVPSRSEIRMALSYIAVAVQGALAHEGKSCIEIAMPNSVIRSIFGTLSKDDQGWSLMSRADAVKLFPSLFVRNFRTGENEGRRPWYPLKARFHLKRNGQYAAEFLKLEIEKNEGKLNISQEQLEHMRMCSPET